MSPAVLTEGVRVFWDAGYQLHVHVNGDGGMDAVLAAQIVRAGSMVRHGLRVPFHSDFMMAPMAPLLLAWCAATRTTRSGRRVSPEEMLGVEQVLRGITIDAAFALRLDHEIGSIVAGKKADFTVLEDDLFELGAERLKDVRVAGTVFEGDVHLLERPLARLLAGAAAPRPVSAMRASAPHGRYRKPASAVCCGPDGDPCVFLRQLASARVAEGPRAA
ncbi:N-substituted formamide deformylase precursor [Variovorax sp. PBL-E5]|nr:N-substituted formamide deformylase precursor [Variovorax sp. PBL-E5]